MKKLSTLLAVTMLLATAAPMAAEGPYTAPNNSWISLKGTVVSANPSTFELDYGSGLITVEMDGWDWYTTSHPILQGDEVTVYGRVDDDLYEVASIEASSVYVKDLNTYFYANDTDEEDMVFSDASPPGSLQLQGTIVDIAGREFTLDTGSQQVRVDTLDMPYNPLDAKGYQQLHEGDFVQVSGELDVDFFERTEIMADSVTTLFKDPQKKLKP